MNRNIIYAILALIKVTVVITGMIYSFSNLRSWRKTKAPDKLRKAGAIFIGMILAIVILTGIEFIIVFN